MLYRSWRPAVIFLVGGCCLFAIVSPQIADCSHLDVFGILELRRKTIKFTTTSTHSDMSQRNSIIGTCNARVRQRGPAQGGAACSNQRSLVKELSPTNLFVRSIHLASPRESCNSHPCLFAKRLARSAGGQSRKTPSVSQLDLRHIPQFWSQQRGGTLVEKNGRIRMCAQD